MNEWIKWEGGLCPVSMNTVVEIKTRGLGVCTAPAGLFSWRKKLYEMPHDIIAYRIADDDKG